jgi:hypothetical protein
MGLLDSSSAFAGASNLVNGVSGAVNAGANLGAALAKGFDDGDVLSAIRAINLPDAGEAIGDIAGALASFGGDANPNDWRVRLSMANWSAFRSSPVLKPLIEAGGLIFPYTPTISINNSAKYSAVNVTHSNFPFQAFQYSDPGSIQIQAPMYVEDPSQGLYWVAALHYLRSLTKMFSGNDPKAGNPPPVVFLNGYGNYVFKNIPVVVSKISVQLDKDCDYLGVDVVGSAAGALEGLTEGVSSLSDSVSNLFPGSAASSIAESVSDVAGTVGGFAALAGTFGLGGEISGGVTHVPTKSTFTVDLIPVYSRDSVRKFSLDRFVGGGYLNNNFGYV